MGDSEWSERHGWSWGSITLGEQEEGERSARGRAKSRLRGELGTQSLGGQRLSGKKGADIGIAGGLSLGGKRGDSAQEAAQERTQSRDSQGGEGQAAASADGFSFKS